MSASAEVNINVKGVSHDKRDAVVSAVHLALLGTGLPDSPPDKNKNVFYGSEYSFSDTSSWEGTEFYSFDVYTKSISVGWDVLSDAFGEKIVRAVYEVDPNAEASVYIYNLDREPDYETHTKAMETQEVISG